MFWKWMPTDNAYEVGDYVDVVSFSSLSDDGTNYVNSDVLLTTSGGLEGVATAASILVCLVSPALL